VAEALLRTAAIAADDFAFIDGEVERQCKKIVREQKGAVIIDKKGLIVLPAALQRNLLRRAVELVLGNLKDIEAVHIEDVLHALEKPAGKVIGLPFGLSFIIEYDRYVLSRNEAPACPFPALETETALNVPGRSFLPGWIIKAAVISPSGYKVEENDGFCAYFDLNRTGSRLTVRSPSPGDYFQPLGMGQPKKLRRFMIDARIPRLWRRFIPVVTSPERVIWVVGYRIDGHCRVTGDTSKVLRLEFKRTNNVIPA
jgi:tRNA(Ile)-lysidine synthase